MCGSLHCFNISSEESRSLTPCTEPQVRTGTAILFPSSAVKGPSLCLHQVLPHLQYSLPPPPPHLFSSKRLKNTSICVLDPYSCGHLHYRQTPQLLCLSTASMFRRKASQTAMLLFMKRKMYND